MYLYLIKKIDPIKFEDRARCALTELDLIKTFGDFNNEESIHRMLCALFDNRKRSDINLLYFRLSNNTFYIQCDSEINLDRAHEYSFQILQMISDPYKDIKKGDFIRIVTNVAPTRCIGRSKLSINDFNERLSWVKKKLIDSGITPIKIIESKKRLISWNHKKQLYYHPEGWVKSYTYDIVAQINDLETLLDSISTGIGRNKAYGCGLLLIKKLK